jgi:polysaccharide export outer membrane protein
VSPRVTTLAATGMQTTTPTAVAAAPRVDAERALQIAEAQSRALAKRGTSRYLIGVDDRLDIRVSGYEKMNQIARVDENGNIQFPPLGLVKASGLTERELERSLEKQLLEGGYLTEPRVVVIVMERRSATVQIIGEVAKQGSYPMFGEKRLVELLSEAGGLNERAGMRAVVMRFQDSRPIPGGPATTTTAALSEADGSLRIPIDLEALVNRGEERQNIELFPGDLVVVYEAGWVHITGMGIRKPGTYPLTRTAKTVRQIVDEASGMKWEASGRITLARNNGGQIQTIPLNYRTIVQSVTNDVIMQGGDKLVTYRDPFKGVLAAVARGFAQVVRVGIYGTWNLSGGSSTSSSGV